MGSPIRSQSPEAQLKELICRYPGPDANATAVERIIRRRHLSVPINFQLAWTGWELHHKGFTQEAISQTLKYYGFDDHSAPLLAQDIDHCRQNYEHYKDVAEKEGVAWPPENEGNETAKADPVFKAVLVMMVFITLLLALSKYYARL
ncbi:hypothetical protein ColTof4_14024 [Colletotrichum tofieldiae]|nr:hypothetical protein ColTof3_14659 [Colletotrichum tofieldiae]GKT81601.1 hypothetical protein ColTof4_14024 [Colletotrichum tofieldiae]GKT97576.1 hypothetical protein Ct61P_15426 [Colletotrichum tofieldiae]